MVYDFQEKLEAGEIVKVPINLLQPIQIGLCRESLFRSKSNKTLPIFVYPIDNATRYAIIDGLHTTFNDYKSGALEMPSVLFTVDKDIMIYYHRFNLKRELKETFQHYEEFIKELPLRVNFVRSSRGIYHVSDLEGKAEFETQENLGNLDHFLFTKWKSKWS